MIFIGEVQQPAWHTSLLQDIEKCQTLRDSKSVIFVIVDNELGSRELLDVLRS
jgi:hypothetical protein